MFLYQKLHSVQQQREHHHQKVVIENFHLSGHTFRSCWTVQDFQSFLALVKSTFGSERVNLTRESTRLPISKFTNENQMIMTCEIH